MSKKKTGRKKYGSGNRHAGAGWILAAGVCAVVFCALLVWAARSIGHKDQPGSLDKAAGDVQEIQIPVEEAKDSVAPPSEDNPHEDILEEDIPDENIPDEEQDAQSKQRNEEEQQEGASLSIVGDSISTFRDYIPAGYYDFFPDNGVVYDVEDTWWKQVLDDKGYRLYVNASSSGSTCVGDSAGRDNPQCGCNELRTGALYGPNGAQPDVIVVYMGTNDLLKSIPMGDNDGSRQVEEGKVSAFSDAYTLMLDKLLAKYPSSKIYCCTLLPVGIYGDSTPYVDFVNGEELTAADYSERITQIAQNKGLTVIDLYTCGITVDNLQDTTADGVHPTPEGMEYIAEAVGKGLD